MQKGNKWIGILIVGSLVAVLGLGALAYKSVQAAVSGQITLVQDEGTQTQDETPSEETTDQGSELKLPLLGKGGFGLFGHRGWFGGAIDYDSYLADALGISVEELQTARQTAENAAIDEAVSRGYITEEQADLMRARIALSAYIDKDALIADALGISVDELQAAREEGKSIGTLIDELGLEKSDVRDALQANYEEAVQAAVDDGIITQDQADEILSGGGVLGFGPGRGWHHGHGPHGFDDSNDTGTDTAEGGDL